MINHYYTLHQVCRNLESLIGYKAVECFTQEKDEIVLLFTDGYELKHLSINLSPNGFTFGIRDKYARARSNTSDVLPSIVGEVLQSVSIAENNRIVSLKFIHSSIVIEFFGATKNNLLILSSNNKIIEAYKNQKELRNLKYQLPIANMPAPNADNFETIGSLLVKSNLVLAKPYAEQLLRKHKLKYTTPVAEIENLADIIIEAKRIRNSALASNNFYLYTDENGGALLSLIELNSFDKCKVFTNINDAISRRYGYEKRIIELDTVKNSIRKKLLTIKRRTESSVKMCLEAENLAKRADDYIAWAELLMSQAKPKDKYGNSITIFDWSGNELSITLDPKFNLLENAAKYYQKAKKIKINIEKKAEFLPKYQKKLSELIQLIDEFETLDNTKAVKQFMINKISGDKHTMKEFDQRQEAKFREFDLGEGYFLYAGRNAANNDELTVKFAKPQDIWMHARGSAGSHTVLRSPNNKEPKPPKHILKLAAQITAYYSKQKNAKYVPVAYTHKKNVYKPKGANPGAVVMSREEVIMAEPKLPEGSEE